MPTPHRGIDECDCVELFAEDAVDRLVVVERVVRRFEVEILGGPCIPVHAV
jgi:hypothetical protein